MSENISDKEKKTNNKVIDFLNKKGFYIVLFLCICVVGVTAVDQPIWSIIHIRSEDNYKRNIHLDEESADEDVPVAEFNDEETKMKRNFNMASDKYSKDIIIVESKPDVGKCLTK